MAINIGTISVVKRVSLSVRSEIRTTYRREKTTVVRGIQMSSNVYIHTTRTFSLSRAKCGKPVEFVRYGTVAGGCGVHEIIVRLSAISRTTRVRETTSR